MRRRHDEIWKCSAGRRQRAPAHIGEERAALAGDEAQRARIGHQPAEAEDVVHPPALVAAVERALVDEALDVAEEAEVEHLELEA